MITVYHPCLEYTIPSDRSASSRLPYATLYFRRDVVYRVYHLRFFVCFPLGVSSAPELTEACPVTTGLIIRVNVTTTTYHTP